MRTLCDRFEQIVVLIQSVGWSRRRFAIPGCRVLLTHPAPSWNPSCVFWNVPYSMPQGGWGWGLGPLTWRRGPGMRALMGFVARLSQASVSTESITARSQSKHRNSTHQSEAAEKCVRLRVKLSAPFRAGRCIVFFLVFIRGQSVHTQRVGEAAAGFL